MENHKIDRLFQEKLSRHELVPTPEAWDRVKTNLGDKKPTFLWMKIAASILLVAVAVWIGEEVTNDRSALAAVTYDQPTPAAPFRWEILERSENKGLIASVPKRTPKRTLNVSENLTKMEETTLGEMIPETLDLPNLEAIRVDAVALFNEEIEEVNALILPPKVGIQITYIASSAAPEPEKSKIEKLWKLAREIKRGEMIASVQGEMIANMRDTKNNFFNGSRN